MHLFILIGKKSLSQLSDIKRQNKCILYINYYGFSFKLNKYERDNVRVQREAKKIY